jgi:hypothetical protein
VEKAAGTAGKVPEKHPKSTAKLPQNEWKLREFCAFLARIMCYFCAKQHRIVIRITALLAHNLSETCGPQHERTSVAFCNAGLETSPVLCPADPHLRQFLTPGVST